jgi:hypothetical protein
LWVYRRARARQEGGEKLHYEGFHDLYLPPNTDRVIDQGQTIRHDMHGEMTGRKKSFLGKLEETTRRELSIDGKNRLIWV